MIKWLKNQFKDRFKSQGKTSGKSIYYRNYSGVSVTEDTALTVSTIWSCLKLLSETVGDLPLMVYRRTDKGKERVDDTVLNDLLKCPNADMTPLNFQSYIIKNLAFRGNAYIKINWDADTIRSLTPLDSAYCTPYFEDKEKKYSYQDQFTRTTIIYPEKDILQISGFGHDGLKAPSLFDYARNSIGVAIATEQSAGKAYKDSMILQGAFSTAQKLTPDQRIAYRDELKNLKETGELFLFLDCGLEFKPFTISPEELQMLERSRFTVEDICRWFNVPPMLVGHTEKSTSWGSGMEQQDLSFLKYCLNPYLSHIQQSFNKNIVAYTTPGDGEYFVEFNINALMRTDSASRAEFYSKALQNGWMTQNEIRAKENLPPVVGGDVLYRPLNLAESGVINE